LRRETPRWSDEQINSVNVPHSNCREHSPLKWRPRSFRFRNSITNWDEHLSLNFCISHKIQSVTQNCQVQFVIELFLKSCFFPVIRSSTLPASHSLTVLSLALSRFLRGNRPWLNLLETLTLTNGRLDWSLWHFWDFVIDLHSIFEECIDCLISCDKTDNDQPGISLQFYWSWSSRSWFL
jgi:hypothetical protein